MDAVFRVDGENVTTSPHAAGPWDARMQHGSAPSSLITWAAEAIPTLAPMQIVRITVDMMRPVPVAPLTIRTKVEREGRRIQLCSVSLFAEGVEVVRGSVLKIRSQPTVFPDDSGQYPLDLPGPEDGIEEPPRGENNFFESVTMRAVRGGFLKVGPAAIWFRAKRAIVEGAPNSQAMRAVLAADFSNGTSSVLDFNKWIFINADLTVMLARQPVGEWILLNSEMTLGDDGTGIAVSRLADARGYFGRAVQCLVVEPR